VEITFRTKKLAQTFNSASALRKKYGKPMARTVMTRLAVLREAPTLSMVPIHQPNRRHQLYGKRAGQYAVDLIHPYRLIFEPGAMPARKAGVEINTDEVTAITIIEVIDYH
jgi:proteic killer suppression protein